MKELRFLIIVITIQLLIPSSIFGVENVPKSYFVKPIDVVCDYPFNDTTKWAVACRVWGLLKYYHPNVTAGKFDWDQVLIKSIGKINEAKTPEQVNNELMQMIRIAGEYEFSIYTSWNDSLNMNVNLCWLDYSFINDSIRQTLKEIASLTTTSHFYYLKPIIGAPIMPASNEKDYDMSVINHYEYRLLSLFIYWNVIYYFFPYKYLMDQSWDGTLLDFIPQFLNAFDVSSYQRAIQKLISLLCDGHSFSAVSPSSEALKFKYISLIDSSTVVRNPPEGSMLERGDIILSIDEKNIKSLRDSLAPLFPSPNRRFNDNVINGNIFLSIMNGCQLTVMRNQHIITLYENKKNITDEIISPYYSISPDIFYVNLDILKDSDIPCMADSLKNYRGVVFDLRNYPIHFNHWDLFRHLIQTQEFCYGLATYADWSHLGAFYKKELITKCPDDLWMGCEKYNGKIVVLINEATGSRAETFAMMFRIHGATLVGYPTAGSNGNVTLFSLPGHIGGFYSGLGFYYPDGTQTQRTGIIPDIEVYPTMDDIMAGRDEVLEAAITFLNSN